MRALPLSSAALVALLFALPARAASDELIVALEPGYERLSRPEASQNAVGGTASAWLGLTDALWLALSGGGFYAVDEDRDRERFLAYEAFGGIVAALDVFSWVPFVELLVGVVGGNEEIHPTIRAGVGVDYLFTPEWSAGLALRYRPLPEEDIADAGISAQLRIGYRFSW